MKPQTLLKGILRILCLMFVLSVQAQETSKSTLEKSELAKAEVIGSAGLNNATNEIDMTGEIINNNEAVITERGFVYSTSENLPTVLDTKIIVENTEAIFSDKLSDISANTIYYIRSYATTAKGTFYGSLSTVDTSTQSNIEVNLKNRIKTYPNPSTSYISLSGLMETKNYIIYNITGKELVRGSISYNNKIDVRFLDNGMYLLKLDDFEMIKFIKE
ncbi:putative secreted protein (Por secretion system target) [Mariniflexile fucanivorans]|uniref:Putative secreted protein (Por secretion system target) n=1 Tax=Mariniflexile fucanivorans TaxID=264023 RepID=A0A4R1RG06_9FLAO|nr:T9SS type A sorting domain-containing protein [Mariniflexile fucanivorans]TCL64893.1 putative secreted protein (Por secretion system target) [Mariniflexile fucanivorans]